MTIKPCPFCGHVGLNFSEGSTFRWMLADCASCGASTGEVRVQTIGTGTKEEWWAKAQASAIDAWNTRAQPAPQQDGKNCWYENTAGGVCRKCGQVHVAPIIWHPMAQPVAQTLTDVLNAVEAHSDEIDDSAQTMHTFAKEFYQAFPPTGVKHD